MAAEIPSRHRCGGCGAIVDDLLPLRCPGARPGDGVDHLLVREPATALAPPDRSSDHPFLRYRARLHAWQVARARGLSDEKYRDIVLRLDERVRAIDGRGFQVTPFSLIVPGLSEGMLLVKDETGNVAGSHKGRHLFGVAIALELSAALGRPVDAPLAIASCGNAALAAAVIARAAGRSLDVYIPEDASASVVDRMRGLGARLTLCERVAAPAGDPCYLRFRDAIAAGALPFACQGPDCALAIDGGRTIAWEIADEMGEAGLRIEDFYVQVGGGALGSACALAFEDLARTGFLPQPPRIFTVQTTGAAPLRRAWRVVAGRIAAQLDEPRAVEPDADGALAARVANAPRAAIEAALIEAARDRRRMMWPWETPPHSVAHGILDDETYDWLPLVRAMLLGGGRPLVVTEDELLAANRFGRESTGIDADDTGTAGLAGLLQRMASDGPGSATRTNTVIFSGARRP